MLAIVEVRKVRRMTMKSTVIKVFASLLGGLTVFLISAYVFQFAMGTTEAKLSMEEAKDLASEQFPGTVTEVAYENGKYEIEIETDLQSFDLVIDASTGEILYLEEKGQKTAQLTEAARDDLNNESSINMSEKAVGQEITQDAGELPSGVIDPSNASLETNNDGAVPEIEVNDETELTKDAPETNKSQTLPNNAASDVAKEVVRNTPAVMINRAQARQIARDKTNNAKVIDIELETDDGVTYYSIELENDTHEFEVEIDAYTGRLIVMEMEKLDDNKRTKDVILSREAIIQLINKEYQGYRIVKIELDDDDGRKVYEIELKSNKYEIELEIEAMTGKVLSFDKELDD